MTTEQLPKAPSAVQIFYCILCLNNEKTYPAHLLLALVFSHPPADRQRRSGSKRTFQFGGEKWPLSPSPLFPQAAMLHWVRKSKQVFIILSSLISLHCCETLRLPLLIVKNQIDCKNQFIDFCTIELFLAELVNFHYNS